jgi:hypothetical protein
MVSPIAVTNAKTFETWQRLSLSMSEIMLSRRHMVNFGLTRSVHQDMCHSKMDTTECTDRYWLSSQQVLTCQACMTDQRCVRVTLSIRTALKKNCYSWIDGFTTHNLLPWALFHSSCHKNKIAWQRQEHTSELRALFETSSLCMAVALALDAVKA